MELDKNSECQSPVYLKTRILKYEYAVNMMRSRSAMFGQHDYNSNIGFFILT